MLSNTSSASISGLNPVDLARSAATRRPQRIDRNAIWAWESCVWPCLKWSLYLGRHRPQRLGASATAHAALLDNFLKVHLFAQLLRRTRLDSR
jgi:hypothetical protein